MQIDLKKPGALSLESVRALFVSKDDSCARQLRVTTDGIAFLSDDTGAENLEGILFRFETFEAHNGYVGQKIATDERWLKRMLKSLQDNWPNPQASYIDF